MDSSYADHVTSSESASYSDIHESLNMNAYNLEHA